MTKKKSKGRGKKKIEPKVLGPEEIPDDQLDDVAGGKWAPCGKASNKGCTTYFWQRKAHDPAPEK